VLIKTLLAGKKGPLETLDMGQPVSAAIETFSKARFRCLPIVEGDKLVGLVTIRDLMKFLAERGGDALTTSIGEAMTSEVTTVSPSDEVETAEKAMAGRFNHLPVVEDGKLVGLLTPPDLLSIRLNDVRGLATDLERYILGG